DRVAPTAGQAEAPTQEPAEVQTMSEPFLIKTDEVAAYLKVANSQTIEPRILQAQAQVLGYIQAPTFAERKNISLARTCAGWQEIILLRDGPLSKLNSFTMDDVAVDTDALIVKPWTIEFEQDHHRWRWRHHRAKIVVNYDRGYTINTVPFDLRQALIQLASRI